MYCADILPSNALHINSIRLKLKLIKTFKQEVHLSWKDVMHSSKSQVNKISLIPEKEKLANI